MKPIVIITIAVIVGVVVVGVILGNQQSQINEINRQNILEGDLNRCDAIIVNSNPFNINSQNQAEIEWENCVSNVVNEYGNDEQKTQWKLSREQKQQLELEHENSCKKLFGHVLSEIGKPNLLQVCLDNQFYLYEANEICGGIDSSINDMMECNNLWIQGQ